MGELGVERLEDGAQRLGIHMKEIEPLCHDAAVLEARSDDSPEFLGIDARRPGQPGVGGLRDDQVLFWEFFGCATLPILGEAA